MIQNQHLHCAPELKRYMLVNLFSGDQILVTDKMLEEAFSGDENELMKIRSGRSKAWFLEDYFD